MNGPLPFNSGNYYLAGAQRMAQPKSEAVHFDGVESNAQSGAKASNDGMQPQQSKKQYNSILNFLRNPENQASASTAGAKGTAMKTTGAKRMDNANGAAPAEAVYDQSSGMYVDTVSGQLIDPSTGYAIDPASPGYPAAPATSTPAPAGYPTSYANTGGSWDPYAGLGYIDPTTGQEVPNTGGGLDYAHLGYASPAPTTAAASPAHSTPSPSATAAPDSNTDPTKFGDDSNDVINIPAKVDTTADEETQKQQTEALKLLTSSSKDPLDLGTGADQLTINADDRKGTIDLTDFRNADEVYVKGRNNTLVIHTDENSEDGSALSPDLVGLDGSKEDWKVSKGADGSAVYFNKETHNKITVTGDAKVIFDSGSEAKNPNAKMSEGSAIKQDWKDEIDKSTSKDIATKTNMENLSESEQDYAALQYVLRMDNDFSGASGDSGWNWFGQDDLTDDCFSEDDWNRCVRAARAINPKLADKVQEIWDNKDKITKLDGPGGDYLSRDELEKILESYVHGETLKSKADQGDKIS